MKNRGLNTKIHLSVDLFGIPVRVLITEGTRADGKEVWHFVGSKKETLSHQIHFLLYTKNSGMSTG